MADTFDGLFDRVRFRYGLSGGFDHQIEFIVSQNGTSPSSCLPYTGYDESPGFDPVLVTPDMETIVDWANSVAFGLRSSMDNTVWINSITIEEINNDLLVTAIKPCVLDPMVNAGTYDNTVGLRGQYLMLEGYTAVGRVSKRMLGGVSGKYNGVPDTLVGDPGAGGGTPAFQAYEIVNRLQYLEVAGFEVQHWGITSQLDVDNELVPLVSNFGLSFRHGQNKRWRKRYNY